MNSKSPPDSDLSINTETATETITKIKEIRGNMKISSAYFLFLKISFVIIAPNKEPTNTGGSIASI